MGDLLPLVIQPANRSVNHSRPEPDLPCWGVGTFDWLAPDGIIESLNFFFGIHVHDGSIGKKCRGSFPESGVLILGAVEDARHIEPPVYALAELFYTGLVMF